MKRVMPMLAALLWAGMMMGATAQETKAPIQPTSKIELFNGKDLGNWTVWLKDPKADPAATFTVADGKIKCTGQPFGYIRTKAEYTNYVVTVEWRFVKEGNTGLILHVTGPDKTWPKGLECQGQHGNQGNLVAFEEVRFEGKKGISTPRTGENTEKPVGEWNVYRAVCRGDSVRLFLNGTLVNTARKCNIGSGAICLQSEGGVWECRKMTLEPLRARKGAQGMKAKAKAGE